MASLPVRLALVAVALTVGAWLVLGLRAVQLGSDGQAVVDRATTGELPAEDFRHGRSLLRRARAFNADISPVLSEAYLLTSMGRREQALATGASIVREEPDNFEGWFFLHVAAAAYGEKKRAARALIKLRALNPLAANLLLPKRRG